MSGIKRAVRTFTTNGMIKKEVYSHGLARKGAMKVEKSSLR